jgi:hypothetical protein
MPFVPDPPAGKFVPDEATPGRFAPDIGGSSSHITESADDWTPEALAGKSTAEKMAMPVTEWWPTFKRQASQGIADTSQSIDELFHAKTWSQRGKAAFMSALEGVSTVLTPATAAAETFLGGPTEAATKGLLPKDSTVNSLLSSVEGSLRHSELDPFSDFKGDTPLTTQSGAIPKDLTSNLVQLAFPVAAQKWETLGKALESVGMAARSAISGIPESSFATTAKAVLAPGTLGPEARETASLTSEKWAELARRGDQARSQVEQFSKTFANAPRAVQLDFINRMEAGTAQLTPQLETAAKTFRTLLDDRWGEVKALGKDINYIENYFPHFWKQEGRDAFLASNARSPLLGSKEFLKTRRIPTLADGIAQGLEPVTTNPIDLTMLKLRSMDRLIVGSKLVDELKGNGLLQFFKGPAPQGWKEITDPIASVRYVNDQGEVVIAGRYAAPENAARVLNNHLSATDIGHRDPIQWTRTVGNLMNMSQLSFSAFHGGFVTMDSITSKVSLAVQQLSRGELGEGLKNAVAAPFAPITGLGKGKALRNAWLNPGGATPELQKMADALEAGGARISMPELYQATPAGSFVKSFKNGTIRKEVLEAFKDHPWKAPLELATRALETSNSWLMEYYVPRQKLGVAYDMIADAIRRNPGMSGSELRLTMQGIWDSVDNRMGQLVYDNLFWNRTLRDSMHLGIRAVGWNLGTIREFGGGAVDAVKDLDKFMQTGDWQGIGRRTAYIFATTATTAGTAAAIQYLYTGKGPQTPRDYFFPRTGAKDPKYGYDERISLPTYVKDLDSYNRDPGGTVASKIHPMWSDLWDIWHNRDFFDAAITNPHDPWQKQMKDFAKFLAAQYTPFTMRSGSAKRAPSGEFGRAAQFVGIQRAPMSVASPETQEALQEKFEGKAALRKKAKEEARGER